ncbi:exosortase K [Pedobacter sp. KLB.chiD]|uniref:exosortase K n=1 Tax=Pedobacter sp. KLB.chiD TaxID=3387402 RepID=UPI0039998EC9
MKKDQAYIFYLISILSFVAIKFSYNAIDVAGLSFILRPTDYFVSIITNSNSVFIQGLGYYHQDLNITVEKPCSGFNFLSISFLIIYCLCVSYLKSLKSRCLAFPVSFLFSWLSTIFVNTSRISTSIFISKSFIVPKHHQAFIHQAEGIFIYLLFLILSYRLINHLLKTYLVSYEKSAQS